MTGPLLGRGTPSGDDEEIGADATYVAEDGTATLDDPRDASAAALIDSNDPVTDDEMDATVAPAGPPGPPRRRKRRRRGLAVVLVLLLLMLPFLLAAGWLYWQVDPPGAPGEAVTVEVQQGWSVRRIGDELEARGVIGSAIAFQVYARLTGAGPFLAGRHELHRDLGVREAASALEGAPAMEINRLALPPGLTVAEIAARVGQLPGRSAQRFLDAVASGAVRSRYQPAGVASLEGLLFPDTYLVEKNEDETQILSRLVQRFDEIGDKVGLANATTLGISPYQAVIVASLIQAEAGVDEDRPLIAAVIYNRLRDKMMLQIDATLWYARGRREGPITNADKQVDSPYNTYRVVGLPPTPIVSVTEASLRAALAPAAVPYKFYVLIDSRGKHKFAETFAEHERNVAEARAKGLLG